MGNSKSTGAKSPEKHTTNNPREDYKSVLLLHKSTETNERKTIKNFRLALEQGANGGIDIKEHNMDKKGPIKDLSWLEDLNNVVVICLSPEILKSLADTLRDKRFADENGHLHANIMAVSFGRSGPTGWPPEGFSRPIGDEKDFCFEFEDEIISASKFEGAKLNSIIATIMGMK